MAQTDITARAQALITQGVNADQIAATGAVEEFGEWFTYNRRELAAFKKLEAAAHDTRPRGTFTRIELSNGSTSWGVLLPANVQPYDEAIAIKADGTTTVVTVGTVHEQRGANTWVYYLAGETTEQDIAERAAHEAQRLAARTQTTREERARTAFNAHMDALGIVARRSYRRDNFPQFLAEFIEREAVDAPQITFIDGITITDSEAGIAADYVARFNEDRDQATAWLTAQGYMVEDLIDDDGGANYARIVRR